MLLAKEISIIQLSKLRKNASSIKSQDGIIKKNIKNGFELTTLLAASGLAAISILAKADISGKL